MYHGIGRAAPIYLQVAFANIWLFGPLLKRWLVPKPEMNASIRTTTALTIIKEVSRITRYPPRPKRLSISPPARRYHRRCFVARQESDQRRAGAL